MRRLKKEKRDGTIDELWDSVEYQDVSNFSATAGNTSAQAKVMWDEDYLYILANVTDDQIDASSENAWTRDGIEIFLDEDNSGEATYAENTDAFQYRFTGSDRMKS